MNEEIDAPICPATALHGKTERYAPGTAEQKYCGTWYRCTKCTSSVLAPSPELELLYAKKSVRAPEQLCFDA